MFCSTYEFYEDKALHTVTFLNFKCGSLNTSSFPFKRNTNNFKHIKRPVNNELHSIINYSDTQQLYCTD